jgi:hypothetical protein
MASSEQVLVASLYLVRAVQLCVVLCYFLRPSSHSSRPPSNSLPAYTLLLSSSWFFQRWAAWVVRYTHVLDMVLSVNGRDAGCLASMCSSWLVLKLRQAGSFALGQGSVEPGCSVVTLSVNRAAA